jgi:hypothetical protein
MLPFTNVSLSSADAYYTAIISHVAICNLVFRYFRPLLLTLASDKATLLRERSWIQLNFSELALLEASLAWGALYHGLTACDSGLITDADTHQAKAINIINLRLNDPATAVTDGVLGAVYTLAYCEVGPRPFILTGSNRSNFCSLLALSKKGNRL